jgi:hypothetical protein
MAARIHAPAISELYPLTLKDAVNQCMNDKQLIYKVNSPFQEITDSGVERIKSYIGEACPKMGGQLQLERFMLRVALRNMEDVRQLTTKQGKWIKRFRKALKDSFVFLDNDELRTDWYKDWEARLGSMIGEYVSSLKAYIRIVDKIEWEAGDFGDSGSCYWGDRSGARHVISDSPNNGAIQIWEDTPDYFKGIGRCWYQYDKKDDVLCLWNRYGSMRITAIAEAVKIVLGFEHCLNDVQIQGVDGDGDYLMYVNGDCSLLVNDTYNKGGYQLNFPSKIMQAYAITEQTWCEFCEEEFDADDAYRVHGMILCPSCFDSETTSCAVCNTAVFNTDNHNDYHIDTGEELVWFCRQSHVLEYLADNGLEICEGCGLALDMKEVNPDTGVCYKCAPEEEEEDDEE